MRRVVLVRPVILNALAFELACELSIRMKSLCLTRGARRHSRLISWSFDYTDKALAALKPPSRVRSARPSSQAGVFYCPSLREHYTGRLPQETVDPELNGDQRISSKTKDGQSFAVCRNIAFA
jgi:hypothetical protein